MRERGKKRGRNSTLTSNKSNSRKRERRVMQRRKGEGKRKGVKTQRDKVRKQRANSSNPLASCISHTANSYVKRRKGGERWVSGCRREWERKERVSSEEGRGEEQTKVQLFKSLPCFLSHRELINLKNGLEI